MVSLFRFCQNIHVCLYEVHSEHVLIQKVSPGGAWEGGGVKSFDVFFLFLISFFFYSFRLI